VAGLVTGRLEARPPERVGLDQVRARVEISLVDPANHLGVRVVPKFRARAVPQACGEERGPVAAVEHEDLARANTLHDLPAASAIAHHALTGTPSNALARTTAIVESFA